MQSFKSTVHPGSESTTQTETFKVHLLFCFDTRKAATNINLQFFIQGIVQFCCLFVEMYYTCYYPEGEEFRERVASIVNYFRQNGYNVIMDVMVSGEITSQGPTRWAETQMRKARKVLVFLSPGLVNLALDGRDNSQSQV